MSRRILIIVVVGVMAGVAGFWGLQKLGQRDASQPATVSVSPAIPPAAVAALKSKAESGDTAAETSLGWAYQKGNGVKMDINEAVKWFQRAADQNYPDALNALGEMSQAGSGVPHDITNAVRLYRLAAEKGSVAGQYNLAYLYEQGSGVEKSDAEAAKWYELAAEGGDPIAQYDIGQRYMLGIGVAANRVNACKWLTLAAAQGQPDSKNMLRDLKSRMSAGDLVQAERLVAQFAKRFSTNNSTGKVFNGLQ
jgi:TPR repeat protein